MSKWRLCIAAGVLAAVGAWVVSGVGVARGSDDKSQVRPVAIQALQGGKVIEGEAATQIEDLGPISPGHDTGGAPLVFNNARVVISGVPLRDCQMGGININGIPRGSTVLKAYLYWTWACLDQAVKGMHDTVTFGRFFPAPRSFDTERTGTMVGSGANPCWCGDNFQNVTFRADVTDIVSEIGAGYYGIILANGAPGSNNYSDAWAGSLFLTCDPVAEPPLIDGASLVVVYSSNCEPNGTVVLYDSGLTGHMFTPIPGITFDLVHPAAGGTAARLVMANADGQVGLGYADTFGFTNEKTLVNGTAISGPGTVYNDSAWNGANGQPLPQLFDIVGEDLDAGVIDQGSLSTNVSIFSEGGPGLSDCVVPVVVALFTR
jgi:hypothetical protein